jgi:hypothetical protein
MSTTAYSGQATQQQPKPGVVGRIWREASRPFRPKTWRKWAGIKPTSKQKPAEPKFLEFNFRHGTVEPDGLALLSRLVKQSQKHPGPIVEIGTLFGRTATHMSLFKAPEQKIITVDTYTWNPWNLSRETHHQLTSAILYYLVQTGNVEQVKLDKNMFYATYRGPAPAMVFLDAIHTYEETKKDILWAKSVGAAIICGHDYSDKFPGVQQVVHEFGGPKEIGGTVFVLP